MGNTFTFHPELIHIPRLSKLIGMLITCIRVKYHRCDHEWTYMGSQVELVQKGTHSTRPVRVGYPSL